MLSNTRSLHRYFVGLIALALSCVPSLVRAQVQYRGGIGRGTVQSACFRPLNCLNDTGDVALPGMACDDLEVCTITDVFTANCVCVGEFQDTDGDGVCDADDNCPTVMGQVGSLCNDNVACTSGDALNADCQCTGTFLDTDGDSICDEEDNCPSVAGVIGGACDDGSDCTTGDTLSALCQCRGIVDPDLGVTDIFGNWLLADGLTYVYSTTVESGAEYEWTIDPDNMWMIVEEENSVSVVAPPMNGPALLCVSTIVADTCYAYACMQLSVMDVGLSETSGTGPVISVRPNPSEGLFELVRSGGGPGPMRYEVLDGLGRGILLSGTTRAANTVIDLGQIPPGVYALRVGHDEGTDVIRFVVR